MNDIIVLAPHPDDEIFALPYINHFKKINFDITILFLTSNFRRRNEAIKSCNFLKCKYLFASDLGFLLKDGSLHSNFNKLKTLIKIHTKNYQTILSPLLEGGHQDHDTTSLATIIANCINKKQKFIYYPTYCSINKSFFYSVMSKNEYCKNTFFLIKKKYKQLPLKSFYLMFIVYKSQRFSWFLLLIPFLITIFRDKYSSLYKLSKNKNLIKKNLYLNIDQNPLYSIHKRCSQKEWMKSVSIKNKS